MDYFCIPKLFCLKYLTLVALLTSVLSLSASAQLNRDSLLKVRTDSIRLSDSIKRVQWVKDSLLKKSQEEIARAADSVKKEVLARRKKVVARVQEVLTANAYYNFGSEGFRQDIIARKQESNEGRFYFIIALVLYLALMRIIFYKYMSTMFTLFFRATLRQQQLREQLLQAPLPALLMNIFFVVSVATYITLVAHHHGVTVSSNFWTDLLYAIGLVATVYLVKFLFLNIVGWILGISGVADTYTFIVFLINKMIGIFLLPFVALLAFPTPGLVPVVLTLSYILIGGMLFYRFMSSYRPVRSEIKLSRIHFFLYLCAFEIAPLLLIYKVLLEYAGRSI
jgi:hypothetical protein